MLHLALVVHLQVVITSVNQIKLDVKVKLIEIIFFAVDQVALEVDEIVVALKEIIILMMDIDRQLIVTVSRHVYLADLPALVQAVANGDHDEQCRENQQAAHACEQSVVRVKDEITTLADTLLSHRVSSDGLNKPVRIGAFFTWAHHLDDHDLLRVGRVVEDISAGLGECERKDASIVVVIGLTSEHVFLEDLEGTVVKDIVGVHHTVLHVDGEVIRFLY